MISRVEQTNWVLAWTIFLGFLLAIFLGVTIASSEDPVFAYITAFFCFIVYIAYFKKFTWQIALLLCYIGLTYRPFGFEFTSLELTCGLLGLLAAVTVWQKRPRERLGVLASNSLTLVRWLLLAWIVYVAIHMVYNLVNPLRPAEFVLKNALKPYFAALVPMLMLWYFSGNPTGIRTKDNIMRTLALLTLVGLIFNIGVTCYGILTHSAVADPQAPIWYSGTFLIPGINAKDNPYMLKSLGPSAVFLGAIALYMGRRETGVPKGMAIILLLLGLVGTLLSSARAALAAAVLLVSAMLLIRKQVVAFVMILLLAGVLILVANLFSDQINRDAPLAVARPLQWAMVNKSKEAWGSIENSSQWRHELFLMAIAEWRSEPRIFWFGRGTYGFGTDDFVAMQLYGGFESLKETSLRRGATHNLVTDLLVTYGLVGCVLYYSLILAIIRFLWKAYRSPDTSFVAQALSLFCLIGYASNLPIATVGGGIYPIDMILLLILTIATLHHSQRRETAQEPSAQLHNKLAGHVASQGCPNHLIISLSLTK